ncbi:hypothetical protein ACHAXT_000087 [Thalassiosira profunda]
MAAGGFRRRHRAKPASARGDDGFRSDQVGAKSALQTTKMTTERAPPLPWVMLHALLYVLSGVTQPILMAYAQHAGLADPRCQLYMLFYYVGPASVAFTLRRRRGRRREDDCREGPIDGAGDAKQLQQLQEGSSNGAQYGSTSNGDATTNESRECEAEEEERAWPSRSLAAKASAIALFDLFAQSMVYTGNNMAGPTIFAIIYSSVTVWAALYSKLLLGRSLVPFQWAGVGLVVVGLSLTAYDSLAVGRSVFLGAVLVLVGTSFHGLTYVMSEGIMTAPASKSFAAEGTELEKGGHAKQRVEPRHLSVRANCAIQGIVATLALLLWQLFYTVPRMQTLLLDPMAEAGTTPLGALTILGYIALANLVHSVTFFSTLKYFPGGATSAGVLKGLQAVLVFAASAVILCGWWGGTEMCWSGSKMLSLVVVVCGIMLYAMLKKGPLPWDSRCG